LIEKAENADIASDAMKFATEQTIKFGYVIPPLIPPGLAV